MPPRRASHASEASGKGSTSSARRASASNSGSRPNSAASSTRRAASKMVKREPVSEEELEEEEEDAVEPSEENSSSEDASSDDIAIAPSKARAGPSSRKAAMSTTTATSSRKTTGSSARTSNGSASKSKKKAVVESSEEEDSTSEDEVAVSRQVKREPREESMSQTTSSARAPQNGVRVNRSRGSAAADEATRPVKQPSSSQPRKVVPVKQEPQSDATSENEDDEEGTPVPNDMPPSAQTAPVDDGPTEDASSASSRASSPGPSTPQAMEVDAPQVTTQEQADDLQADSTIEPPRLKIDAVIPLVEQGPKKRLVIHKIVLVDFKSYAGRQEIGPFHKSFSSIVGPNGSGKSNTIDALLFVFGFKATKMRQGKLSELIHNSEGKEDIPQCSVEVWFREIIDLPDDDAFEVVPKSTLVVTRTAFRNNSSKYTINSKTSTFTEVTTLLKDKGIDLDHKRFLILQGEVESIAQMKPKAPNEHEDGLLEYLEDIIGTSRYKEPIATCLEEVDRLNEERLEKTNRVKLVEREKAALEAAKKEADAYVKDQNQLAMRQSELYQVYQLRYQGNMAIAAEAVETASKQLQVERDSQAGMRQEVEELDTEYQTLARDHKELEKHTNEVSKELVAFEREDVQMQEKRKHLINKQKKLKKTIHDDTLARSEASTWQKSYGDDMEKLKAELVKHETNLAREEAELEKICDGLKDKTAGFSAQIDTKQAELQPWLDKLAEKQAAVDLATNQRNLLKEKAASIERGIEEATTSLQEIKADNAGKEEQLQASKAEYDEMKATLQGLKSELQKMQVHDQKLRSTASSARQKTEEAKASQAASRSKGDVLSSLTKLKEQGRLSGFHGRLGNLGRIDDKYDVAISTACPGLDNLVCDTVEAGQACLEHLRRNNLGRATILCLGSLARRDLHQIETPEGVPRLFDLVTPKNAKLAPAFYQVLQNTLVAKDLEQANRIAFGSKSGGKRWRVVTLDGKLIDVSGTMSGGGNRVARGAMSSKFADDGEVTVEAVARLEKESAKAEEALQLLSSEKQEKEQAIADLQRKLPEVEMQVSKTEMALRAGKKRIEEAQKRIKELQGENRPQTDDVKKISALDKEIEKLTAEHSKLQANVSKIQGEIKSLQEKILEVGGVRLRSQQVKVEGIKEMSDHANDQLTKAEVGKSKAEKDLIKLEKALKTNGLALEEVEEELAALEKSIREKTAGLESVRRNVEEAKAVLEEKSEELAELKALLDEKQAEMNKFRAKETELEQEVEKAKRKLAENEKSLASVVSRLERLELQEIDEDDDEDENENENEEERQPKQPDELRTYTEEELGEFDAETLKAQIALLEERIQAAKPNLSVLKEYRRREKEFLERAQDLERITQARDAAKQSYDDMRKQRLDEFMAGFNVISMKLKEMYQMITLGGNAELELVDSLDPFSEGIIFSVMPPKKSWKNISNLSGGEKTLSSLALVFALHVFKPTPLYFMDEIDAALDFRNVSIVANYIKERTKNAQFIIISLRNNMFELASRLVGIYKVQNATRSVCIDNEELSHYA